ncbi:hypothetical protein [Bacillus sp. JJ1764]|uniref:hypothetical protein n=1 Tax=Bacillus sp. JJ1764 TaxID=3122964 RepID=UPI002FFEB99E
MRIHDFYRNEALISLNGSIASLIPVCFIIVGNLSFLKNQDIMLLAIPFFVYSFISFQFYLYKRNQSNSISKQLISRNGNGLLLDAQQLLVLHMNTTSSSLQLYFSNGFLAGSFEKVPKRGKEWRQPYKIYVLRSSEQFPLAFFVVKKQNGIKIEVYDQNKKYMGCLVKKNEPFKKDKKELFNETGELIGMIEGSPGFMDEKMWNLHEKQEGRLRRGWMPLQWSALFPNPNTPVLSFKVDLSQGDRLIRMSLLINEFFLER